MAKDTFSFEEASAPDAGAGKKPMTFSFEEAVAPKSTVATTFSFEEATKPAIASPENERSKRIAEMNSATDPTDPNYSPESASFPAGDKITGEGAKLRDEFFTGVDNTRAALKTVNVAAQAAQLQRVQDQLSKLESSGQGDSPEASGLRKTIEHYGARLPKMIGGMTEAQADAQRGAQMTTRPSVAELNNAKTFGDAWEVFKKNPYDVIAGVSATSLPTMLPALVTGAVMGPAAGAVTMGGSSAVTEAGSSLADFAQNAGVDTTNPQAVEAFFSDRKNLADAMSYAGKRAGIIGTLDAVSGGVAGKTLAPRVLKNQLARQAVNMPAQMAVQAGLGAGGEAGGQLATKGTIDQPGQVLAEAAGELASAPTEVVAFSKDARAAILGKTDVDQRVQRLRDAGEKDAADLLEKRIAQQRLPAEVDRELGSMQTEAARAPEFQNYYRELRTAGVKPVEAAGRTSVVTDFRTAAAAAGMSEKAIAAAVEGGQKKSLADLPGFLHRYTQSLAAKGLAQPVDVGSQLESARDTGMDAAMTALYPDDVQQNMADVQNLEGQQNQSAEAVSNIERLLTPAAEQQPVAPAFETGNDIQITPESDAAHAAATSPLNDLPEPTLAQKDAGNYKVGRLRIAGMDISIENPQGSTRSSTDQDGNAWTSPMRHHYGYFRQTTANDGDKLDVFVVPGTPEDYRGPVFVVDQVDPKTGKLDEHKVVLGAQNEAEAEQIYRSNYSADWQGLGAITRLPLPAFKAWAANGNKKEALGDIQTPPQQTPEARQAAAPLPADQATAASDGPAGLQPGAVQPAGEVAGRGPADQSAAVETPGSADQQRTEFKAAEAKRQARAARLRSGAFDRNPLMAFLGKHGISSELASEFAPGPTERRKAIVPGYGPVFRKSGMNLDLLAERAAEDGFLPPGSRDERALHDLISRAVRGERVLPQYAEGAVESHAEAINRARFEDYREADALGPADMEAEIKAVSDNPEEAAQLRALLTQAETEGIDAESVLEEAARITENGTQEQYHAAAENLIRQALTRNAGSRSQDTAGRHAGEGQGQAAQPGRSGEGRQDSGKQGAETGTKQQGLTAPTRAEILAKQDRAATADVSDQRNQVRKESEAGAGLFELTAQEGRQDTTGNLFDKTQAEDRRHEARGADRRTATDLRKRVSEMSEPELRDALLTDHLTGLKNRRAYDESAKLPTQVSIDADSLKWVNDNLGHESGDQLLKAIGQALGEETQEAYHVSGDEFVVQAHTEAEARSIMERARLRMSRARIEATNAQGKDIVLTGVGVSYGISGDLNEAERFLGRDKAQRESQGLRAARGEVPPNAAVSGGGEENQARGAAAEEVTRSPASRGKNEAVTNPKDVVGKTQGGRSADDISPGAANKHKLTQSEFDAAREFVDQVEALAEKHGAIYVRWSASKKHDLSKNSKSRDYGSSEVHSGLSAQKIDADMHPVTIARRIAEYGSTRVFGHHESYPRLYLADEVGTDSDNAVSITNLKKLIDIPAYFVKAIDKGFHDAFDALDDVKTLEKRLARITDPAAKSITIGELEKARETVKNLLSNEPTAPESDGATKTPADAGVSTSTADETALARGTTDQTDTPAFRKWFGDSKVVDADGNPLVVYHGTNADFDVFDREKSGKGPSKLGFWFTSQADFAENFGSVMMPAYVSLKNPKVLTQAQWDEMRLNHGGDASFFAALRDKYLAAGHDGVAIPAGMERVGRFDVSVPGIYAAFHPEQIKSATGNRGTFDPSNPDITMARGMDAAAFRRAFGAPEPMTVDRASGIVNELTKSWEKGPSFKVVATADDLPSISGKTAARGTSSHTADTRGLIYNGTAYIVAANNPTRDHVARTIGHEAIGHYGLWKMLGDDGKLQFQRNLQLAVKTGNKPLNAIRDKVRRLYVDDKGKFNLTPAQEANEIAAFAVEEAIDPVTGEFRPGFGFMKSVWAKVADFLRGLGIKVKFTNAELQGMLVSAMRGLQAGQRLDGGAETLVAAARDTSTEGKALQALSETDDLFALPKSDKTTMEGIAADNDPEIKVEKSKSISETLYTLTIPDGKHALIWVRPPNPYGEHAYSMELNDGETSNLTVGRPGVNPEDVDPSKEDVYLDVSGLKPGGSGNMAYNIAATFAHNTGRIFIGDPSGISDTAMRRRLENMISTALKFGTTDHIAPHPRQVKGDAKLGVPPLRWVYGDSLGNIERMIDASVKATDNVFSTAKNLSYDPDTGTFSNAISGRAIPAGELRDVLRRSLTTDRSLAGPRRESASASEAGWRTIARRAVFASLLGEGRGSSARAGSGNGILGRLVSQSDQLSSASPDQRIFYARGSAEPATGDTALARGAEKSQELSETPRQPGKSGLLIGRDEGGRPVFAPGQALYNLIGRAANPLLVKLQMKAASPALRQQLRAMKLNVQKAQDTALAVAQESNKLSTDERLMVSDIIEKELKVGVIPPEHAIRLASAMNEAMHRQSDELVRLGMLSPETAKEWDGRYLPRFYESKLKKQVGEAWADAARLIGLRPKSMKGIKGQHLKGRGLYETISESSLADYESMGWKVRDHDYTPSLPSVDGTVQVWRDFTRAERDAMGEIRDAGFRFVMGYMQTQRDIALGRMFEGMANNSETSSRLPKDGWVRVPDTTVEGTGAKRYGKLAGRYVPMETLSQLTNIEEAQSAAWRMYRSAMAVWKSGKTSLNPVSHMNNVLSNLTMAHFAGIGYHRADKYVGALRDFVKSAPMVKEARDAGLFLGTMSDAELMNTMPTELKALAVQADSKVKKGATFVFDAMTFWLRKPMGAAYQAEDTFFRYLIYRDARQRGVSPQDAVDYAQKYIFTYDDLPKGARYIRDFGIPFFAYTYKAVPALLNTALTRPDRFAAPAAVLLAANAAAYAIATGNDDDDWLERLKKYLTDSEYRAKAREKEQLEREHLPPWMKGYTALLTPRTIRLGMDELTKLPVFLDTSRIVPGGDIFDVSPNAGGIPLPQSITPSHPLFSIFTAMIANKDLYFGKELVDANDTRAEAATKRADWIWKQLSPAIAVGNYHWERGMNALAQATGGEVKWMPDLLGGDATGIGRDGNPVQPSYAAMQTFGIKARPIDLDTAEKIDQSQRKKMISDIDAEMRKFKRLNRMGAISDRALDKAWDSADEKKDRIRSGLTVDGDEKK